MSEAVLWVVDQSTRNEDNLSQTVVFWFMAPCSLVGGYQCFGVAHYLHLQRNVKEAYTLKTRHNVLQNPGNHTTRYHNPEAHKDNRYSLIGYQSYHHLYHQHCH
jgi:hypothetical protein